MLQDKYLYFRTEADEDADDDIARSCLYPVSSFMGVHPTDDTELTLCFQPQVRHHMMKDLMLLQTMILLN